MTRLGRLIRSIGKAALANRLGVKPATLTRWVKRGVPKARQGALKAIETRRKAARKAAHTRAAKRVLGPPAPLSEPIRQPSREPTRWDVAKGRPDGEAGEPLKPVFQRAPRVEDDGPDYPAPEVPRSDRDDDTDDDTGDDAGDAGDPSDYLDFGPEDWDNVADDYGEISDFEWFSRGSP